MENLEIPWGIVGVCIGSGIALGGTFFAGIMSFRVKYAKEIAQRPDFDQTKELIAESSVVLSDTLKSIQVSMERRMDETKADNIRQADLLLDRIRVHGDKIVVACGDAQTAKIIAENMDTSMERHKRDSQTRMSRLYKYLKLPDETNGD